MLWDMALDGVALKPKVADTWGIDDFDGLHIIPDRKSYETDSYVRPGSIVDLGPYAAFDFSISGWVAADSEEDTLRAVNDLLGRFGKQKAPMILSWKAVPENRLGEVTVQHSRATRVSAKFYTFKIALRNLWGAWYSEVKRTGDRAFNASPMRLGVDQFESYIGTFSLTGPATNPLVKVDGVSVWQFNGSIPAGKTLQFNLFPSWAVLDGKHVMAQCSYSARWGHLFALRNTLQISASGITAASKWSCSYRDVEL